jgi:2-dehydro-3-deoxygluconokinase
MTLSCTAFGEVMLRLDPAGGVRLVQADRFEVRFTGAEANVAASLAQFGIGARVVSAVPDDMLGEASLAFLRRFGVDVASVLRQPGRLGLFYLEPGGAGRPAEVIYDRANSVFARTGPDAYDWAAILNGQDWLHVSGTAAAVGPAAAAALDRALAEAQGAGVSVSLDVNYRSRLWDAQRAGRVLRSFLDRVDVLLGAGEEIVTVLDQPAPPGWSPGRPLRTEQRIALMEDVRDRWGLRAVAGTERSEPLTGTGGETTLRGLLSTVEGTAVSRGRRLTDERGRVGTGDAYAAGVIRGLLLGHAAQEVVEFAAAAAQLKQSIAGDVNIASVAEVEHALSTTRPARLRR